MKIKNTTRGFTLIELIIYMGLLSILLVVMSNIFVTLLETKKDAESTSAVDEDGRFIMARLSYDINRATAVTTPVNSGDIGATLVLTINSQTYTYAQTGNNLTLNDGSGAAQLNGSGTTLVAAPTFQKIRPTGFADTVKVQFSLRSVIQRNGGSETQQFNLSVARKI
jgi:prepilin-type N-terminal cleavage/methylation domain-containing protein